MRGLRASGVPSSSFLLSVELQKCFSSRCWLWQAGATESSQSVWVFKRLISTVWSMYGTCSNLRYLLSFQLQYPVYWDLMEFCDGFRKLLDHLQLDKVRLHSSEMTHTRVFRKCLLKIDAERKMYSNKECSRLWRQGKHTPFPSLYYRNFPSFTSLWPTSLLRLL